MRRFEYQRAASIEDAVNGLGQADDVRLLAGGTDLLPLMKADIASPRLLIDVKRVAELGGGVVDRGPDGVSIGALTSLSEIEAHPLIRERYVALSEAAALAATPQLRNMATLGGNLLQRPRCWYFRSSLFTCWLKGGDECQAREGENQQHAIFTDSPCVAVHPSDPAAALLAFDARVLLRGRRSEREVVLGDFFRLPYEDRRTETALQEDELVVSVLLPPPGGLRTTYLKAMNRQVWSFALVSVAAGLRLEAGRIVAARLVLGSVAPIPRRLVEAEQALIGSAPDVAAFDRAAEIALAQARPLSRNGYKLALARGLIRQALRRVGSSDA